MNPNDNTNLTTSLFVYGTLKKGYRNHDHFCRYAVDLQPATTWGRLYQLPAGFPTLEIPETAILAHGTRNPFADAKTQMQISVNEPAFDRPTGDWDLIHGEIITFSNPYRDLPPIDRLEGFKPGRESMYSRVLAVAQTSAARLPVWLYWMKGD